MWTAIYSVLVDDTKAIRTVVDYLLDGGRKTWSTCSDLENDSAQAKRRGFVRIEAEDVPQPESRVFTAAYGPEGGMRPQGDHPPGLHGGGDTARFGPGKHCVRGRR